MLDMSVSQHYQAEGKREDSGNSRLLRLSIRPIGRCLATCIAPLSQSINIPPQREKLVQPTKLGKFEKVTRLKRPSPMAIWAVENGCVEEPLINGIACKLGRKLQGWSSHEDHPWWWGGISGDAAAWVSYPKWIVSAHAWLGKVNQCSGAPWSSRLRCAHHSITMFSKYGSALLPAQAHLPATMTVSLAFTPVSTLPNYLLSVLLG